MRAAVRGGEVVLQHRSGSLAVRRKADDTPVTQADEAAQVALEAVLVAAAPDIPVVSEEGRIAPAPERRAWPRLWLVDPLDGTKEYIRGGDDFSVNVALCDAGGPWLGVIYAPVRDRLYYGAVGWGAYLLDGARGASLEAGNGCRLDEGERPAREVPVVVASTSHFAANTERLVSQLRAAHGGLTIRRLSSAIKLGMVAAGEADYYPRFGPTMEWDTAAGDALLRTVGGRVVQARTGRPLRYNKHDLHNPPFLALGPGQPLPSGLLRVR
jgi:3'(2'), 5'-bisphosphate nucleotidase